MEKEQTYLQSLERIWQMCVFQSKPQELKVGIALAATLIPFYLMGIFVTLIITPGLNISMALGTSMVLGALGIIILFLWGLHFYKGTRENFLSAVFSVVGTQCVILFINLPTLLFYNQIPGQTVATQMVLGLMVILLGWSLAIIGRILHFSLQNLPVSV